MPSAMPRARAWRHPCSARATRLNWAEPSNCAGRGRARSNPVVARRRSISRVSHRVLPARLPSYADYILRLQDIENPRASRSMLRLLTVALPLVVALLATFDEHEVDALQLEVRSPLQFQVRSPPKSRPLRPQPAREINTIAQPRHTPLRTHTTPSAHITMDAPRHTRMRARRSTPRSTSSPTSSPPRDTNPPSTGVPPSPAGRHACGAASVGPAAARARPLRMLQAHAHEAARARDVFSRACPTPWTPRPPRGAMQLALAIGMYERARRLACFADGLRVAPPGAGSRSCMRSGSTATTPSTSPPRPAGATSTPRSRGSGRHHARGHCRLAQAARGLCL